MINLRCDNEKGQLVGTRGKVTRLEQVKENESIIHQNAELRRRQDGPAANIETRYSTMEGNRRTESWTGSEKHGNKPDSLNLLVNEG